MNCQGNGFPRNFVMFALRAFFIVNSSDKFKSHFYFQVSKFRRWILVPFKSTWDFSLRKSICVIR